MNAPVSESSTAWRRPTAVGSAALIPQPGMRPTFACVSAKRARSDATIMSQASAISSAPVTHTPFTAAIVGRVHARTARVGSIRLGGPVADRTSLRSTPDENDGSAPVITTTTMASFSLDSENALAIRSRIANDMALRNSGRSMVIVRTPSASDTLTSSLTSSLMTGRSGRCPT